MKPAELEDWFSGNLKTCELRQALNFEELFKKDAASRMNQTVARENEESDQIFRTAFGVPHRPVPSEIQKQANKGKKKQPVINPLDNTDFMKKLENDFDEFALARHNKKKEKEAAKLKLMSLSRKNTYFDIAAEED